MMVSFSAMPFNFLEKRRLGRQGDNWQATDAEIDAFRSEFGG